MQVEQNQEVMLQEFQLVELEERLEMTAMSEKQHYCCECVGNPDCG